MDDKLIYFTNDSSLFKKYGFYVNDYFKYVYFNLFDEKNYTIASIHLAEQDGRVEYIVIKEIIKGKETYTSFKLGTRFFTMFEVFGFVNLISLTNRTLSVKQDKDEEMFFVFTNEQGTEYSRLLTKAEYADPSKIVKELVCPICKRKALSNDNCPNCAFPLKDYQKTQINENDEDARKNIAQAYWRIAKATLTEREYDAKVRLEKRDDFVPRHRPSYWVEQYSIIYNNKARMSSPSYDTYSKMEERLIKKDQETPKAQQEETVESSPFDNYYFYYLNDNKVTKVKIEYTLGDKYYFEYEDRLIFATPKSKVLFKSIEEANEELARKNKKPLHELDINMEAMRLALSNCQTSIDISGDKEKEKSIEFKKYENIWNGLNTQLLAINYQIDHIYSTIPTYEDEMSKGFEEDREFGGFSPFNNHFRNAERESRDFSVELNKLKQDKEKTENLQNKPYIARLDVALFPDNPKTIYLGEEDIEGEVHSLMDVAYGNLYYYSDYFLDENRVNIVLKRIFDSFSYLTKDIKFHDELSKIIVKNRKTYIDQVLLNLLERNKDQKKVYDILVSIQANQYNIISSDISSNILVEGSAGSGKTMILFYRLMFLAYNDKSFKRENTYIVTPSEVALNFNKEFIKDKRLDECHFAPIQRISRELIEEYIKKYNLISRLNFDASTNLLFENKIEYLCSNKLNEYFDIFKKAHVKDTGFKKYLTEFINNALTKEKLKKIQLKDLDDPLFNAFTIQENSKLFNKDTSLYLTYPSLENISYACKELKEKGKVSIDIDKYNDFLKPLLSKDTKLTQDGKILTTDSIFKPSNFLTKDKEGYFKQLIALTYINLLVKELQEENEERLDYLKAKYALSIFKKNNKLTLLPHTFEDYYLLSALTKSKGSLVKDSTSYALFDEYQNYSPFEINVVTAALTNPRVALFGDKGQQIEENNEKDKLSFEIHQRYELKENYRNAYEITEHVNKAIGKDMIPVGLPGEVKVYNPLTKINIKRLGRTAIIYKDTNSVAKLIRGVKNLNNVSNTKEILDKKINLIIVGDAKGLEFDTVYVLDEDMTYNERYVAFTRAIKNLYIISA